MSHAPWRLWQAGALSALVVAGLALAAAAPSLLAQTSPAIELQPVEAAESGPLVAPGPEPDLVLLYTGGVGGYVEPCG